MIQTWYPPIWRRRSDFDGSRGARPTIEHKAKSESLPIDLDKPGVTFDTLYPEFAERYGSHFRWTQVVSLRDWSFSERIATVYPTDFRQSCPSRIYFGSGPLLATTEGFLVFGQFKGLGSHWQLEDGTTAHANWFKMRNIESKISSSGRATRQIIETLGGFGGVACIAHKGIVTLLDSMARRPVLHSAHQDEFRQKVQKASKGSIFGNHSFDVLIQRKVVELGLELKCPKCGGWSWYRLRQLDSSITCDLCLRVFEFPITTPTNSSFSRWAYRVIGPFALPNFADGGYSSALAIRLFSQVLGPTDRVTATWSAGHELTLPDGNKAEADFVLWYQRKRMFANNDRAEIVFGEAKSFGKDAFTDEDVSRMKRLAEEFPGAILVFATMKDVDALSKAEVNRQALTMSGRLSSPANASGSEHEGRGSRCSPPIGL